MPPLRPAGTEPTGPLRTPQPHTSREEFVLTRCLHALRRDGCVRKHNTSSEDTSLARESGLCRRSHRSPAPVLPLLFFLLPMQMKSGAFSALELPLGARWQGGRWRARRACKRLQADAEPCTGTSTQTLVCVGDTRVCPHLGMQS